MFFVLFYLFAYLSFFFFFFNDTATTEIYTLSLHDALPILSRRDRSLRICPSPRRRRSYSDPMAQGRLHRSEEHTSELQSPCNLVCRLLLEKKKQHSSHLLSERLHHNTSRPK